MQPEKAKKRNKAVALEIFLIIIVFAVSLFLRLPNIDRHLESGHEWLTAHTLIQQRIWFEDGALENRFRFVFNFPREADKFINNASMSDFASDNFHDASGNYYYPSYPSLAVAFPYIFFRALNIYPDVIQLQIFSLVLHLVSALLLYFCVVLVQERSGKLHLPAVLAASFYLLLPMHLWFHSNTYFVEIFVQPAFILLVFLTLYLKKREDRLTKKTQWVFLLLLFFASFAASSSEWLGLIASVAIALFFLVQVKKAPVNKYIVICLLAGAAAAMAVYVWQYSEAIGFSNFVRYLSDKFIFRVGVSDAGLRQVDLKAIGMHYLYGFYGLTAVFLFALILSLFQAKKFRKENPFSGSGFLLYAFFVPAFLHQAMFLNFTSVHDYSPLKMSMFLILCCTLLIGQAIRLQVLDRPFKQFFFYVLIFLCFFSAYHTYENYYAHTIDVSDPNEYSFGPFIGETAREDEVVFLVFGRPTSPHLIFYSGRNFVAVDNIDQARQWLQESPNASRKGIIFTSWSTFGFERFEVEK